MAKKRVSRVHVVPGDSLFEGTLSSSIFVNFGVFVESLESGDDRDSFIIKQGKSIRISGTATNVDRFIELLFGST